MTHRKAFAAAVFLMLTALPSAWAQRVVLYKANGTVVKYNVAELDSLVFEEKEPPVEGEHNWVDLGLPSGTLWATCNVGSDNPEAYGDYKGGKKVTAVKSSNKKVARISGDGTVTFRKKGKVTITCTAKRGGKKTKIKFNVTNP